MSFRGTSHSDFLRQDTMVGCTGSTILYPTAGDLIPTYGPTSRTTRHRSYSPRQDSNLSRGNKPSCSLLVIPRLFRGVLPLHMHVVRPYDLISRHFNWMAQHGVDGAFLQRFAGQCDLEGGNEGIMRIRDEVGDRVREAAEKEGRVFAIM